jgi:hypothetical protein
MINHSGDAGKKIVNVAGTDTSLFHHTNRDAQAVGGIPVDATLLLLRALVAAVLPSGDQPVRPIIDHRLNAGR